MNYIFYLLLLNILIIISLEQNKNYCDLDHNCDNCLICGEDSNNYCSCNFYNTYCKTNNNSNGYTVVSDFLYNYNDCINNNGNMENICGNSNLDIDLGINKTIKMKSSNNKNFFCYYNVKKINNNNNEINIKIKKETNDYIYFNIFFIVYYNNDKIKISSWINTLAKTNSIEIIEYEAQKISVYIDIPDGQNIDKISVIFGMEYKTIKKIRYEVNSSVNEKIIYGILLAILGLVLILLIICLVLYCKNKKINNSKCSVNQNHKNPTLEAIVNSNKEKIENLLKTDLRPKKYFKKNAVNNCFNCTICLEEFEEGISIVVTTKCNHIFHYRCFKNWVYKNIFIPKCPNCNISIINLDYNQSSLTNNTSSYLPQEISNTTIVK